MATSHFSIAAVLILVLSTTHLYYVSEARKILSSESDTEFIKAPCGATAYPDLSFTTFSSYASDIQASPKILASKSLSLTLNTSRSASKTLAELSESQGLEPREAAALRDCLEEMSDSIDEVERSIDEMDESQEGNKSFAFRMSDIETWVSAALTDEDTCMDGFSETAMDGDVKATVRSVIENDVHYGDPSALRWIPVFTSTLVWYEDCIKDCDKAVERGRELRSDFKMIAKALTRKGTALMKMAKCSKDYDPAIETFQKALTEHRNPDTLKKLNDAEKAKKELEQQEYFAPKIADEEREKGNECFKLQKHPEAVKYYTESLRRNPKDPKAYSNRAACCIKLGALPEGLKDAEKFIELDPTFSKGYTRKGAVQFFLKEYDKALETYQEGLKHDPKNQELLDGVRRCVEQINKASRGDLSPEELKERQAKAMQDPEIQNILSDPVMRQVLVDFQENPKAAQEHMKNPMVMNKIQKLVTAGIVQIS